MLDQNQANFALLVKEAAYDNLGIYPAAVFDEKGVETKRTPYQDGWNAAALKLLDYENFLGRWAATLTPQQKNCFQYLYDLDVLFLSAKEKTVELLLNVNDIFCPAADAETIEMDELENLVSMASLFGIDGVIAWVAVKRGQDPWKHIPKDFDYMKQTAKEKMKKKE